MIYIDFILFNFISPHFSAFPSAPLVSLLSKLLFIYFLNRRLLHDYCNYSWSCVSSSTFLRRIQKVTVGNPGLWRRLCSSSFFSAPFPPSALKRVAPTRASCRRAAALTLLPANEAPPLTSDRQHAHSAQNATTTFFLSASYLFLLQLQPLASSSSPLAAAFITRCMQTSGRPMNVDRALLSTHDLYLTVLLCASAKCWCVDSRLDYFRSSFQDSNLWVSGRPAQTQTA